MLGILLIDKPTTWTSHDVVAKLRGILGVKRIGHAGTLDPLASGLLVAAVGPATRFLQYLSLEPKVYETTLRFGIETNTFDADGETVKEMPVPEDLERLLMAAFPHFVGEVTQLPPMYSAVKKDGKPLYAYARKGEVVERATRTIYIDEIELKSVEGPVASLKITCSGGTYVRTLAHDLGQVVGCGAHVASLCRTQVGIFDISESVPILSATADRLIPLSEALRPMEIVRLNEVQKDHVRHGRPVRLDRTQGETVALADSSGEVIGIAVKKGPLHQPECVIPEEALAAPVPS